MQAAPLPANEAARLAALHRYAVLDTAPEVGFDDLTELAATICGTPMALVSLVDCDRQWFKSRLGVEATETPRDLAFCAHTILSDDILEVPDVSTDPRFHDNPLATGGPQIQFYAGAPMKSPDGHALGSLCVMDNVARTLTVAQRDSLKRLARQAVIQLELRRAAMELAASDEKSRLVLAQVPAGFFECDAAGLCTNVNTRWTEITGWSREEALGAGWIRAIHPEDRERLVDSWKAVADSGLEFKIEARWVTPAGRVLWMGSSALALRDNAGVLIGYVGTQFDITEAHQAHELLQRERFFLGETIQKAPIAIAMLDTEMRYLAWSEQWVIEYELAGQPLLGRSHYEVFPDLPERWRALHRRALAGEALSDAQDHFQRPDGSNTWLRWAIHPWRQVDGTIGGVVMVTNIVSDLVEARLAALESVRVKSEFLASMSHEIRTPMNGVIGMTGLLLDSALTPEQRETAEMIGGSAEALLGIINDILDFSKIEAGKLAIEESPFDLGQAVNDVADLLITKVHEHQLEFVIRHDPRLPRMVRGDAGRLRQILTNMVANALKFTTRGHVLLTVRPDAAGGDGTRVRFEISDTGIGIPQEKLDTIFERFIQADTSTTRRYGGTGLGLAICRQLVTLMHGEIGVTSEVGRGSTFWFSIPLPATGSPATDHLAPPLAPGSRVLVVDDFEITRRVLCEHLEHLGLHGDGVADGATALDRLRSSRQEGRPYLAALVDDRMPGMDGETFARRVAADQRLAGLPMLLISGAVVPPNLAWLASLGFDGFIRKPVRLDEIVSGLRQLHQGHPITQTMAPVHAGGNPVPQPDSIPAGDGLRVLVVDDNSVNQKVAARMLAKLGCRVTVAADGREAVDMVQRLPHAMVFMDCMMPDMDGYEATAAIRALEGPVAHTPIIAMTANAMQGDRERCLAAGMDDYLSKPVQLEHFRTALGRWSGSAPVIAPSPGGATPLGLPPVRTPPVDLAVLEGFRLLQEPDAPDVIIEFIDLFLGDLPDRRAAITRASDAGEAEALRNAAHALKGSSAYVGAHTLSAYCKAIEAGARSGEMTTSVRDATLMEQEATAVQEYLQEYRVHLRQSR
ncbi:MAG: response regulator [Gemmatimonadales bacterium]